MLNQFKQFIKRENLFSVKDHLLIAVSGGVDSVVLCELCKQAGYTFSIAHCNFQLRGEESERDEKFVRQLGQQYGVETFVNRFDTKVIAENQKNSIETTARNLRYDWFKEMAAASGKIRHILTAHHADDNIETVMMHFFRGTGIKGMRGILPVQGMIVRPLLFARRSGIEQFASEHQLAFVTDNSNFTVDYTRNFFRNELIPSIATVFPAVQENVLHNIERMRQVENIYRSALETFTKKLVEHRDGEVHIPVLKLQRMAAHPTILYEVISAYGFTAHQLPDVLSLLEAGSGKYVQSSTHRVLRNRAWLIISPLHEKNTHIFPVNADTKEVSFEKGVLQFRSLAVTDGHQPSTDPHIVELDAADIRFPLLLRKWKQGDYFYPLGMDKKKKLSRFFIDQKLSLTDKEKVWVLESDKRILWVMGMRIDNRFRIKPSTKELLRIRLLTE